MKRPPIGFALLLWAGMTSLAYGQAAQTPLRGDAEAGRQTALRACATCHTVPGGPAAATDTAPTLLGIARNPQRNRGDVTAWLMEPHMPMPNFQLTVREIADLAAYIESLRGTP